MSTAYWGWPQADEIVTSGGEKVGMTQYCGYHISQRTMLSLCGIDETHTWPRSEVVLTWGEVGGGSRKPHVECHQQTKICARVCEAPYSKAARDKLRAVI